MLLIVEFSYSQERNKAWSLAEGHKKGGELGIQCFGKVPARFLMRGIPIPLSRAVNFEIPCALWTKHRERERHSLQRYGETLCSWRIPNMEFPRAIFPVPVDFAHLA